MRITSRLAVLATAATAALGLTALPAAASPASPGHSAAGAGRGAQAARSLRAGGTTGLWVARLHTGDTVGRAVAVSPDGSTVFAAGQHNVTSTNVHGETVAYNAVTGAQIWQSEDTAANSAFEAITAAGDGSAVFVTGYGKPAGATGQEALTVAYDAATGATLWTQAVGRAGEGRSIAVAPDGSAVFVTGNDTCGKPATTCYLTAAYNAATGATLWTEQVPNTGVAGSIAVAPDGSAVFVTGVGSCGQRSPSCYVTVGLSATTGANLWTQTFSSRKAGSPAALAVSPDGSEVFVTGQVGGQPVAVPYGEYGTVAYNAATGTQLWKALYRGPGSGGGASDIAVSPDGSEVFVTGENSSAGFTGHPLGLPQYATVAYGSGTGTRAWLARYGDVAKGASYANSIAVSPDGSEVFVTGQNINYLTTVAYSS